VSQQTIVAVAIILAVVVVILVVVVLLWPLESVAMAMTRGKQSYSLCGCLHRRLGGP
jgi:preprotein translocase subunit SecG